MPLVEQPLEITFAGGVDEKTRAELVDPAGKFLTLVNAVQAKSGAVGKPFGHSVLTRGTFAGGTITTGKRVFGYKDETDLIDGHYLYAYSSTPNSWKSQCEVPECMVTRRDVLPVYANSCQYDIALVNGYTVVVYMPVELHLSSTTHVTAAVFDSNGTLVSGPTLVVAATSSAAVKVVAIGNTAILLFADGAGNIAQYNFDTTSTTTMALAWQTAGNVVTDARDQLFDVVAFSNRYAVVYVRGTPSSLVKVATINTSGTTLHSAGTGTTAPDPSAVAIGGVETDTLWVAYSDAGFLSGNVVVLGMDPTTLAVTATRVDVLPWNISSTADMIGIKETTTGAGIVVATSNDASHEFQWAPFSVSGGAVVAGAGRAAYSLLLEGRPFTDGTNYYAVVRYIYDTDSSQHILAVVDLSTTNSFSLGIRPVAVLAPRLSLLQSNATPTHIGALSATKFLVPTVTIRSSISSSIELNTIDFAHPNRWQAASLLDSIHLSGGLATVYDGNTVVEEGFLVYPIVTSVTTSGTGLTGDYHYVAIYEWVDARGNLHRSSPTAVPGTISLTNQGTHVVVTTLQLTAKHSDGSHSNPVSIVLYRTAAGLTTFYRVTEKLNNQLGPTVTFTDALSDTALASNEELYSQPGLVGGALAKTCPSGLTCLISHQDRLFGIGDDGRTIWYTGQAVPGEGAWWHDNFTISVATASLLTALASMDGRLIGFERNAVFYVDGQGPGDNGGTGQEFTLPAFITTDVGCIEPRSVCVFPGGVTFQSSRGLELLNRSMQVETFWGRAVEDTLTANPVITSACVDEPNGRIIWTAVPSEGSASGVAVIYDYINGAWSVRNLGDSGISSTATGVASAAMVGVSSTPVWTWLTPAGRVYQRSSSTYEDAGQWQTMSFKTAEIKPAGVQGYWRCRDITLIAKNVTGHDLTITIAYDGGSFSETHTFTAAQVAALTTPKEQIKIQPTTQKCRSMQLQVVDATPSSGSVGTGQGTVFFGLRIQAAVKQGTTKVPVANQA